jgi:hypothetical protein
MGFPESQFQFPEICIVLETSDDGQSPKM